VGGLLCVVVSASGVGYSSVGECGGGLVLVGLEVGVRGLGWVWVLLGEWVGDPV